MKSIIFIIAALLCLQTSAQTFERLHKKAIVVDTHNDFLSQATEKGMVMDTDLKGRTHSDLTRWKQGGVDVQFFSVFCDGHQSEPFAYALRQMDTLDAVAARNPDKIVEVPNYKQLRKTVRQHKIAAMFGVEGGHMIENDLGKLDSIYKRGARYMTLTWNNSTPWATSAYDETFKKDLLHKGLSDFGKQVVQRMNQLGMMVDISHVGEQTFYDVINTTTKPIIASHSAVYNLCPHQRNLKDEQIKAIAKNGGVIQVNFYSGFLDSNYAKNKKHFLDEHKVESDSLIKSGLQNGLAEEFLYTKYHEQTEAYRASFSLLIQHIEYIIKLVGIDYVGLGSDFDGIESPPKELNDVTTYPLITKALVEKGYSKRGIKKVLGRNLLRVLKANEVK